MKNKIIIDVRESEEFKSEHIIGALNIPLSVIESCWAHVFDIFKEDRLIIMCRTGNRSQMACAHIKKYQELSDNIEIYTGGLEEYKKQGGFVTVGNNVISLMRQVQVTVWVLIIFFTLGTLFLHQSFLLLLLWIWGGLLFAGLTWKCGLAKVLSYLPFNK